MIPKVNPGVDIVLQNPKSHLGSLAVGLITNPTGVTNNLTSTIDAFHNHPDINLKVIFGPEHGVQGDVQDALPVEDHKSEGSDLQVFSLYGTTLKPTKRMLEELDALIFDIQDIGVRFYTYVSTMMYCMEAAAEHNLAFIVLDRPNPLNGVILEGPLLEPGFESFLGLHHLPIRHGMTVGELALLINQQIGTDLKVIRAKGWTREMWFDETGLYWVHPSPNIPTLMSAIIYPGTCLFEGVNISEGRGTTHPFECIGAPWINGRRWAQALNALNLEGVRFRSCYFTPVFDKYTGELCRGVQVHVSNRDRFTPVKTGLHMLANALTLWPDQFEWVSPKPNERYHFDLLMGSEKIRTALTECVDIDELIDEWRDDLNTFGELRKEHLLYPVGGVLK